MSFTASLTDIVQANSNGLLGKNESWARVALSDIAQILNGFAFSSAHFTKGSGFPLLRIRDILDDSTETNFKGDFDPQYIVNPGDLVIGMDGDFNSALWKGKPALLNQRVCKVTTNERFYDLKFLNYVLPGYLSEINQATSSITVKHLSSNTISKIPLPLPPLREQRRIVARLDQLFTQLEAGFIELRKAQLQLKRYRQAVLKAAVTGELTREWREAHKNELEPASELLVQILKDRRMSWLQGINSGKRHHNCREPRTLETSALPSLPSLWIWASLESVAEAVGGYAFKSKLFLEHGKHQVVKMANIKMGILDLSERPAFVDDADPEVLKKFSLRSGDLLVTLTGTRKKRDYGFVVALEQPTRSLLLNQRIARLRPYKPILPRYLQIVMQDPVYRDRFFFHETGNVGQGNVGMAAITVEPVAIAPLAEQRKIVSEFERLTSIIDALEQTIDLAFKQADRVRQSILKDAFEGKLVPQDPNDEPTELLLERIKLERAKREAEKQAEAKSNRKPSTKKRTKRTERPAA